MKKKQFLFLLEKLIFYRKQYYVFNSSEVSDVEYDNLFLKLKSVFEKNPNWNIDSSIFQPSKLLLNNSFEKVKHKSLMFSLDSIFNKNEFINFFNRVHNFFSKKINLKFCCELKIDGLAINLLYRNGILVQASTRGDGLYGEDVLKNVFTITKIPRKLNGILFPDEIEIRGEIYMDHHSFKKLNQYCQKHNMKGFSSPRNAASGSLRQINPKITFMRKLSCFFYGFGFISPCHFTPKTQEEFLVQLENWGFPINRDYLICSDIVQIISYFNKMEKKRQVLNFDIDGIVVKLNSIKYQDRIGFTNRVPRWAIALKFQPQEGITLLKKIIFQVGRTGVITPVAFLNPIKIVGATISKATLYNIGEIKRLKLKIGDYVIVRKCGDIIPKITGIISSRRITSHTYDVKIPLKCPSCGFEVKFSKDSSIGYCINHLSCPDQLKSFLKHFCSRKAMNIVGMGPKIISQLVNSGKVNNLLDIYKLNTNLLVDLNRINIKSAQKLINFIERSKNVKLNRFIYALGIRGVGESLSKLISKRYVSLFKLINSDLNSLINIPGIGLKIANNIYKFFKDTSNINIINQLINNIGIDFH